MSDEAPAFLLALENVHARLLRLEQRLDMLQPGPREDEIKFATGHRPKFWYDVEVREAMIALRRQATIADARSQLLAKFGPQRTPSASAIGRFWQTLDNTWRKRT